MEFRHKVIEVIEDGRRSSPGMFLLPAMLCLNAVSDIMGADRRRLARAFVLVSGVTYEVHWNVLWRTLEPCLSHNELVMVRAGWDFFNTPSEKFAEEFLEGHQGEKWTPVTIRELFWGLDSTNVRTLLLALQIRRKDYAAMEKGIAILRNAVERDEAVA